MTKLEKLEIARSYYPNAQAELDFADPFQLLIAVTLSAQTTDVAVNKVTKPLFELYPDASHLKKADYQSVYNIVKRIGLANTKSKNIIAIAKVYDEEFNNIMPKDRDLLVKLPGVGIKTANVCLANTYNLPYMAVDTHVHRVSTRLAIVPKDTSVLKTEQTLERVLKGQNINDYHHSLIHFGRYHCTARSPKCSNCILADFCRYNKENN